MNVLFKVINVFAILVFILSVCMLDSESNIFFITSIASGLYLVIATSVYFSSPKRKIEY